MRLPRAAHARGEEGHAAALAARATDVWWRADKVRQDILGWAPSGARVPVIANGVPLESRRSAPRGAAGRSWASRKARSRSDTWWMREVKGPDGCCRLLDNVPIGADVDLV